MFLLLLTILENLVCIRNAGHCYLLSLTWNPHNHPASQQRSPRLGRRGVVVGKGPVGDSRQSVGLAATHASVRNPTDPRQLLPSLRGRPGPGHSQTAAKQPGLWTHHPLQAQDLPGHARRRSRGPAAVGAQSPASGPAGSGRAEAGPRRPRGAASCPRCWGAEGLWQLPPPPLLRRRHRAAVRAGISPRVSLRAQTALLPAEAAGP